MKTANLSTTLNFVAVPTEVAQAPRRTMRDAFGHVLKVTSVTAPCRHCLRIPKAPEDMILLSYRVLPDNNPYAEIGPIFVHVGECERYAEVETFPNDFLARKLVLRAYDHAGCIADAVVSEPGEAQRDAVAFLRDPSVGEVHVRHVSYTCFDFKIVRGE